jgi:hypothetical protein
VLAGLAIAWASGGLGALGRLLGERRAGAARAELVDELFGPVLERPELRARAQGLSGAEQQALLFELARDGVARLPDEALLERLALLREVAASGDEATCAMVLVGGPPAAAAELLAALDDGTLRRWLALSRDAVLANLRGDPARPLAPEDAERARAALVGALSPADAERFDAALRAPAGLSRREACALARATLEAAAALPAADRQLVARLFASG